MYSSNRTRFRSLYMSSKIWPFLYIIVIGMVLIALIFLTSDGGLRALELELHHPFGLPKVLSPDVLRYYSYAEDDLLNGADVKMDDPKIIKKIFDKFLLPPPKMGPNHVYQLDNPSLKDPSMGQSEKIRNILQHKKNGFFIECGALDGETRSNTLFMERFLNWTGLLIEADPLNFSLMLKKNRKAWLSPTCLSKLPYPQIVSFKQDFNIGRISGNKLGRHRPGYVDVQCFPIYSYLLALNITHVDYFSLDVEGDELEVLKTLPFDEVDIETLSVEYAHVDDGKDTLREFMESKGYKVVAEVTHPNWLANDFIFVKKSAS